MTAIECICADGTAIAPFVIFKGTKVDPNWMPDCMEDTPKWRVSSAPNGWTSHAHAMEWMRKTFELQTCDKAKE